MTEWLAKYMFAGQRQARTRARRTAAALANHASHGRFLSRDQAKAMKLVVDDLELDQVLQDAVLSVFHAFNHTFNADAALKIIENHKGKAFIKKPSQTIVLQQPMLVPVQPEPPSGSPTPPPPPASP